MAMTRFVRNYTDQSTDSGFQFEFFCDRCGTGYQTEFVPTGVINTVTDVLDAAGSIFGGFLGTVANLGERARSATWEKEHDAAFRKAVTELQPNFHQCGRCGNWVDNGCWSNRHRSCKDCIEEAAAEDNQGEGEGKKPRKKKSGTCPSCDASVPKSAKFCPECGEAQQRSLACPECGAESSGKFCAECGCRL